MADDKVGTHEAKTHLSEYLNRVRYAGTLRGYVTRVRYAGERIVIERHRKPVAALVSTQDLERLEASSEVQETAEERYRRGLEEAGIKVTYPTGERVCPESGGDSSR